MTKYITADPEEVRRLSEQVNQWVNSTTAFNSAKAISQIALVEYLLNQQGKTLYKAKLL